MSRLARQETILKIVRQRPISSQAELVRALRENGVQATQATVSRDLRQLGLVKVAGGAGARYVAPNEIGGDRALSVNGDDDQRLRRSCREFVTSVQLAEAMLVLTTPSGHANAAAWTIDHSELPEVVGTIAGDDTVLILLRSEADRVRLERRLRSYIE